MTTLARYLFIFLLLAPLKGFSQNDTVPVGFNRASHTRLARGWIPLDTGWRYRVAGDPNWQPISLYRNEGQVPVLPHTVLQLQLIFASDYSLEQSLVMRIYQSGASEVSLDGKLLYTLGLVSTHADSAKLFSPNFQNLSFPLLHPGVHTLSVRFLNIPATYPLFFNSPELFFESWISTTENAQGDYIIQYYKRYTNHIYMAIGAAIILSVLFFSLFVFFRSAVINLYFAGTALMLVLFLVCIQTGINTQSVHPLLGFLTDSFSTLFALGLLLCVVTIFEHRKNRFFKLLMAAGLLTILLSLLVPLGAAGEMLMVNIVVTMMVVSVRSYKKNKAGAIIIFSGLLVMVGYLLLKILSTRNILPVAGLTAWEPFVLLVPSVCLAIYLGYSFGTLSREKQQILAAQNERLELQVQERTAALNRSLADLKAAQAQLIQAEKMASLGELTAGIAHEIQNPLNFVNNFSDINTELTDELVTALQQGDNGEAQSIAADIRANEEKINHHGKRAGAIVRGMLEHSKSGAGTKEETDINALCEECLRLAYHAAWAKNKDFTVTTSTDYEPGLEKISIVSAAIGKVLLNILANAFYALKEVADPQLHIATRKINHQVIIAIRDNGSGIAPNIIDKIFQPFFTTKPTGEGIGLGLSLSYDIVKGHGGEIGVHCDDKGTEMRVRLEVGKA